MSDQTNEMAGAVKHLKKSGLLKILAVGFALGILLLLLSGLLQDKKEESAVEEGGASGFSGAYFNAYKASMEQEARRLCSSVSGVKNATVILYFDGVGNSIYAQNTQSGNSEKVEYVIIGSGSNSHALYLGEELPRLSGIGVVCDTGNREDVRNRVAMLLASTYGLPLTRVYVAEGNGK